MWPDGCLGILPYISCCFSMFLHEVAILTLNQNFDNMYAMDWIVSPPKSYVEALPLHGMV